MVYHCTTTLHRFTHIHISMYMYVCLFLCVVCMCVCVKNIKMRPSVSMEIFLKKLLPIFVIN